MAYIADTQKGGIWPLQNFNYKLEGLPLDLRHVRYGIRIDRRQTNEGELGHYQPELYTYGDVIGWLLWGNRTGRPIPAFAGAWPTQLVAGPPDTQALPILDETWVVNRKEFVDQSVSPPPELKLPKGTYGITLDGTDTTKQSELFFPTDNRLVAVNWDGNPELASLVYDLDNNDCFDPERYARLHSMMRVMRTRPGRLPFSAELNSIAWQLARAGQDGLEGFGLVVDSEGALVVGVASSNGHGPFYVGPPTDQHDIALTADGERVNPVHIDTLAYFRSRLPTRIFGNVFVNGDAPLEFQNKVYSNPAPLPFRTRTHLRLDPFMTHPFFGEQRDGLWRWESETTEYVCETPRPEPPVQPPPADGKIPVEPGEGGDRGPVSDPNGWQYPIDPLTDTDVPPGEVIAPSDGIVIGPNETEFVEDPDSGILIPNDADASNVTNPSDLGQRIDRSIQRTLNGLPINRVFPTYQPNFTDGKSVAERRKARPESAATSTMQKMNPGTLTRPAMIYSNEFPSDLRRNSQPTADILETHDQNAPVTMRKVGFQDHNGDGTSVKYTEHPTNSQFCGGTAGGGQWTVPPEMDITDGRHGANPDNLPDLSKVYDIHGPCAYIGVGRPHRMEAGDACNDGVTGIVMGSDDVSGPFPSMTIKAIEGDCTETDLMVFDPNGTSIPNDYYRKTFGPGEMMHNGTEVFMDADTIGGIAIRDTGARKVMVSDVLENWGGDFLWVRVNFEIDEDNTGGNPADDVGIQLVCRKKDPFDLATTFVDAPLITAIVGATPRYLKQSFLYAIDPFLLEVDDCVSVEASVFAPSVINRVIINSIEFYWEKLTLAGPQPLPPTP